MNQSTVRVYEQGQLLFRPHFLRFLTICLTIILILGLLCGCQSFLKDIQKVTDSSLKRAPSCEENCKLFAREQNSAAICVQIPGKELQIDSKKCKGHNLKKVMETSDRIYNSPIFVDNGGLNSSGSNIFLYTGNMYNVLGTIYIANKYASKITPYFIVEIYGNHYLALAGDFEPPTSFYTREQNNKLIKHDKYLSASVTLSEEEKSDLIKFIDLNPIHRSIKKETADWMALYNSGISQLSKWKLSNAKRMFELVLKQYDKQDERAGGFNSAKYWVYTSKRNKWSEEELEMLGSMLTAIADDARAKLTIINNIQQ